jgi:antitoxin component HigA of HigAB toxin-antitoxin module
MPHVLDPKRLSTDEEYWAALDEFEDLMTTDLDTPQGQRFEELAALLEAYESGHQRVERSAPPASG